MSKGYHFSNLLYIVHLNLNRHDTGEISVTCRNTGKGTPSSLVTHNRPGKMHQVIAKTNGANLKNLQTLTTDIWKTQCIKSSNVTLEKLIFPSNSYNLKNKNYYQEQRKTIYHKTKSYHQWLQRQGKLILTLLKKENVSAIFTEKTKTRSIIILHVHVSLVLWRTRISLRMGKCYTNISV